VRSTRAAPSLIDTGFLSPAAACGAAPAYLTNEGNKMIEAQAAATKVMTDLTCWSCGGETLKEMFEAVDPNAFRSEAATVVATMQSECTKCGAHSVNAAQAHQNKTSARASRKAMIKEANRKSS
jgi:hypothetical protein